MVAFPTHTRQQRLSRTPRTLLGIPVALVLMLHLLGIAAAQTATPEATPGAATAVASPIADAAEVALASSVAPTSATASAQVVISQSTVVKGAGTDWTLTTPLDGLTYRTVSATTSGTTAESTFDPITNAVITTGTVADDASIGQATVRIVAAVQGGAQPGQLTIVSELAAGDAADDATTFFTISAIPTAVPAGPTPVYTDEAATPTTDEATPAAEEATAIAATEDATPATDETVVTEDATPVAGETTGTPEVALASSVDPIAATGSSQVVVSQSAVIKGAGSTWTLTTPLEGLTYRTVSTTTSNTTAESTFDPISNSVITTGTVDADAPIAQATVRIVAAVQGGAQPGQLTIVSELAAGDAADDATAFFTISAIPTAVPAGPTPVYTDGAATPAADGATPVADETAAASTPVTGTESGETTAEASPATTSDATAVSGDTTETTGDTAAPTEAATDATEAATEGAEPTEASDTAAEPTEAADAATGEETADETEAPSSEGAETSDEGEGEASEAAEGEEGEHEEAEDENRDLYNGIIAAVVVILGGASAVGISRNLRK